MRAMAAPVLALMATLAAPAAARAQQVVPSETRDLVVVVAGERIFHEVACPVVKGIRNPAVTMRKRAVHLGYKSHDCRTAINAAVETDRSRFVWVDLKTKRYHLAGCSLVGVPRAQMSLERAQASYRPCNACKPPAPAAPRP